jgi:hypothetical protein
MILYSASFYLFYLSVAALLVYAFKNYRLALLYGLYLVLFVSDTFYWPNNEIHQGIGWLMLAFAVSMAMAAKQWPAYVTIPLSIALFYLAIWTHPLVMFAAIYLWFFLWLSSNRWPFGKGRSIFLSVVLVALCYFKFHQGMTHGYDSSKIEVVTGFDVKKVLHLFSSPQLHFFIKGCVKNYWLFVIIAAAGWVSAARQKEYLALAWTMVFAGGYLLLICITFWDVNFNRFYIESEYMPLTIICCAPFVFYTLPTLQIKHAMLLMAVIFCIRFAYIQHSSAMFSNRVAIMEQISNKMKERNLTKVIIKEPVPGIDSALVMNWGAPVESIFLSGLRGEIPQRTFLFADEGTIRAFHTSSKDTVLGCWEKRGPASIDNRYFQQDTSSTYTVISYDELMGEK